MTLLITGVTGFLGGTLLAEARLRGPVLAVGRDPAKCVRLGALALDLSAPGAVQALTQAAEKARVRQIVHTAALTAPWGRYGDFHRANVEGTRTVLEVAKALGVALIVHISTPSVYFRLADQERLREDSPLPHPFNAYAATKAEAEALALLAGAVVLRPRGIYGRGDQALLPRLLRAMQNGPLPLLRGGVAATDLTHVSDVTAAIWAALAADAGGQVFNISGGVGLAMRDVVQAVGRRAGIVPRWRAMPLAPVMAAARAMEAVGHLTGREPRVTRYGVGLFAYRQTLDLGRARAVLGWKPQVDFAEGLGRTFAGGL